MNPEIKQKWVDALRSGEYKKGTEYLYSDNGFCCLGVLCDLHSKETGEGWIDISSRYSPNDPEFQRNVRSYQGRYEVLPRVVMCWAGLPDGNPDISFKHVGVSTISTIAQYNDRVAETFDEIADLIEKEL